MTVEVEVVEVMSENVVTSRQESLLVEYAENLGRLLSVWAPGPSPFQRLDEWECQLLCICSSFLSDLLCYIIR